MNIYFIVALPRKIGRDQPQRFVILAATAVCQYVCQSISLSIYHSYFTVILVAVCLTGWIIILVAYSDEHSVCRVLFPLILYSLWCVKLVGFITVIRLCALDMLPPSHYHHLTKLAKGKCLWGVCLRCHLFYIYFATYEVKLFVLKIKRIYLWIILSF